MAKFTEFSNIWQFLLQIWKYTSWENDCVARVHIWLIHRLGKTICPRVPISSRALLSSPWSSCWRGSRYMTRVLSSPRPWSWRSARHIAGVSSSTILWSSPSLPLVARRGNLSTIWRVGFYLMSLAHTPYVFSGKCFLRTHLPLSSKAESLCHSTTTPLRWTHEAVVGILTGTVWVPMFMQTSG